MNSSKTGIVILAAGSSSRLGQPKQNLVYNGQSLLQRTIETALASACGSVVLVLGAHLTSILPLVDIGTISIAENNDWPEGMASSIRAGITHLKKNNPDTNAAIIMLCDQPFVDTHILNMLMMIKTNSGIAACTYNDTIGPPALFDEIYFDELLSLKGSEGARHLLQKYKDQIALIPFEQGSIDIDTIQDYRSLK